MRGQKGFLPGPASQDQHLQGLDYLRAGACLLVVLWHRDTLGFLRSSPVMVKAVSIFYYNVALLAVPIFFLVSLRLFVKRREEEPDYFEKKRAKKLLGLYFFWSTLYVLWSVGKGSFNPFFFQSTFAFALLLVTGGNGLFYFFFALIMVTTLANIYLRIRPLMAPPFVWGFFGLSCLWILFALHYGTKDPLLSVFWNPLNFLPYIFAAILIDQKLLPFNTRTLLLLGASVLTSILLEWTLIDPQIHLPYLMPPYTRLSVVLSALLLLVLFEHLPLPQNRLASLLARYSLPVYCLHLFVGPPVDTLFSRWWVLPARPLASFFAVIAACIFIGFFLKKVPWLQKVV